MENKCCCIDKSRDEKEILEKYLKYLPIERLIEDQKKCTPGMKVNDRDLQDLLKMATRPPKPDSDLQMFPEEERDGNMGPLIVGTISFAIIATIGLLVFAYQYAK